MGVGTVAGYHYGVSLNALLSEQAWAWFQSLVAGTLLHVIFGRPHLHGDEDPHHSHVERTPASVARYEGLGNLAALAALAMIGLMHGATGSGPSQVAARFIDLALESAPALLLAYVIGGFVAGELPAGLLRWVSAGGRASQAIRGTALGLPLPICSCSALPLYRSLSQRGVAPAAALAFLIAAPEVGLTALLVSLPLLGWEMTLVRVGAAAALAILVGYVVAAWATPTFRFAPAAGPASTHACDTPGLDHDHAHDHAPKPRTRLGAALRAGMVDLVDGTAPWILVGLLVAAAAEPLLTQVLWARWPDVLEVFVFAVVGMPIFVCAAGATPLVAVLIAAGVSPGAALAFLLTGPATNVSTFGVLRQLHGPRMAWIFAVVTACGATALGVAVNWLPLSPVPAADAVAESHGWIEQSSLALLALLYLASLLRRGARAFIGELADTGASAPAHAGH